MAQTKHFGPLAAAAGALVAVALLVLMLILVNPQTAGATFPSSNGKIAYSAWDGNDAEIFAIDPDLGGKGGNSPSMRRLMATLPTRLMATLSPMFT